MPCVIGPNLLDRPMPNKPRDFIKHRYEFGS